MRSRLEVATALAWEALVETHAQQALSFVRLLQERVPIEEALLRYLMEVDLGESMASAVRTRVLADSEREPLDELETDDAEPSPDRLELHTDGFLPGDDANPDGGWRRFRPDVVMRGFRERQKRDEETEGWIRLALARAEEAAISTHVDNAITFAALLEELLPFDRAVQEYLEAVGLSGGRAQAVHQRTMARLAEVHLPIPAPARH